jgi:hypothetical protein
MSKSGFAIFDVLGGSRHRIPILLSFDSYVQFEPLNDIGFSLTRGSRAAPRQQTGCACGG